MPTIKQQNAFNGAVGNGGNITQAMRDAQYSENTLNTPQKLTESRGWQELMEEYLPDTLLGVKHKELLEIKKKVRTFKRGDIIEQYEELDSNAVGKGLDMAYKLKGYYAPEKKELKHSGTLSQLLNEIEGDKQMSDEQNDTIVADETTGQEADNQVLANGESVQDTEQTAAVGEVQEEQSTGTLQSEQVDA